MQVLVALVLLIIVPELGYIGFTMNQGIVFAIGRVWGIIHVCILLRDLALVSVHLGVMVILLPHLLLQVTLPREVVAWLKVALVLLIVIVVQVCVVTVVVVWGVWIVLVHPELIPVIHSILVVMAGETKIVPATAGWIISPIIPMILGVTEILLFMPVGYPQEIIVIVAIAVHIQVSPRVDFCRFVDQVRTLLLRV